MMADDNNCNLQEDIQLRYLLYITAIIVFSMAGALYIAPYFWIDDTSALARYVILKVPSGLWDIWVLLAAIVAFDYITPGDSLCIINENPLGVAILYSAIVIGTSIALSFG